MSIDSKIGYEIIDNYVDSLKKEELIPLVTKLLKESDSQKTLLSNLVDSFIKVNNDDQIIEENWDWFVETLNQVEKEKEFIQFCRKINIKLYVLRHFTKIKFGDAKFIENELKFKLKTYFNLLKTNTKSKFIQNLYDLPFEFSSLLVRYYTNILIEEDEKRDAFKASKKIADTCLKDVLEKKNDFLKQINDISLGLYTNISYGVIKELLDMRVFFNYNALNAGALEFIVRFINSKEKELEEKYGKNSSELTKELIFSYPCYIFHIKRIKEGKDAPFFLENGTQNEKKEFTYDDYVKKILEPKNYSPTTREFGNTVDIDSEMENSELSSDDEGGSLEMGSEEPIESVETEEPTEDDLMSQI